jgi:hypothetical protein
LNLAPGSHTSPLCSTLSHGSKKPVSIDSQSPTCKEMEAGQGAGRDVRCDVWTVVEEYRISLLQPK